jgi:hypothetical protein
VGDSQAAMALKNEIILINLRDQMLSIGSTTQAELMVRRSTSLAKHQRPSLRMIIVNIAHGAIRAVLLPEFVMKRTLVERFFCPSEFRLSFGDISILVNIILQSFSQIGSLVFSFPS